MKPADNNNTENLIKNLHFAAGPDMRQRILSDVLKAHEARRNKTPAQPKPPVWRIIMKNPITKLAAAAVIIAAAFLTVYVVDKSTPAAFGIEQVIAASNNVRFLHVKSLAVCQRESSEFWIKSNELGRVEKARYYLPETEDGVKLITWTPEKLELWFKSKRRFLICQTNRVEGWMQSILETCQPKLVMTKLLEGQKAGEVDIDMKKPEDRQKPVVMVATYKTKPKKEIYYIDQGTDLISRIEVYSVEGDKENLKSTMEFCDYNVPIDEKMFSLEDDLPDDVRVADQLNQLIGVPQGNMTDEQAAAETVRQFFQALIDKDYKKAGLIVCGELEEYAKEEYGALNIIKIISIGSPIPQADWDKHGFKVPCELEIINSGGQKIVWKPGAYVRPGDDEMHPDRWNITGGVNVNSADTILLPDNEKYEKMTPKEAAEAFFKACAEKNWDEFMKFWPGSAVDERTERMKSYLGGLEIISIGEPFKEGKYPGWYVPYEIKLLPTASEFHLRLSNANAAKRFVITGMCDSKLRTIHEMKWSNEPNILPSNDVYAKMSPEDVVKAFNAAFSRHDFDEMRKFMPDYFVEGLKHDFEGWKKRGEVKEGQPFCEIEGKASWSAEQGAYFVKCRQYGQSQIKKWNLAIRNDNAANRYLFDGGL